MDHEVDWYRDNFRSVFGGSFITEAYKIREYTSKSARYMGPMTEPLYRRSKTVGFRVYMIKY